MNTGSLYTHIQNGVATLEFFHRAGNSLPIDLLNRLVEAFKQLSANRDVRVIILKSDGDGAFCAGASLVELSTISNFEEGKKFFMGFANVINAMRTCTKLIIGRIQGKAVGGGVGLIAACDYCYASIQASIKLSELTVGIGPFVIAPVLERRIGIAALSELSLGARSWKNAYWAKEKGLYGEVFDSSIEMDKEIDTLTLELSKYNPEALKELKKEFWKQAENWNILLEQQAEISGKLVLSNYTKEALDKFKNH
jgi:methylglutaconyl-CoA hydratase